MNIKSITPFLWYDGKAEEAARWYTSLFKNSAIESVNPMVCVFHLNGLQLNALNGGPMFQFTEAISLFVTCDNEADIDRLWTAFSDGGTVNMALAEYPFSKKYGWIKDKYGVSWQLFFGEKDQSINPSLLFVGEQAGKAQAAIDFYTSIFEHSSIVSLSKFGEQFPGFENRVQHCEFKLNNHTFMAMESHIEHHFAFNEAFSFVVNCESQEAVDFFWEKLSAGGELSRCGWLKDQFGVWWQVVPMLLGQLMNDKDQEKAGRVMQAMMGMTKLDCAALQAAYDGN